jgi:hypothetical protein
MTLAVAQTPAPAQRLTEAEAIKSLWVLTGKVEPGQPGRK